MTSPVISILRCINSTGDISLLADSSIQLYENMKLDKMETKISEIKRSLHNQIDLCQKINSMNQELLFSNFSSKIKDEIQIIELELQNKQQ